MFVSGYRVNVKRPRGRSVRRLNGESVQTDASLYAFLRRRRARAARSAKVRMQMSPLIHGAETDRQRIDRPTD